MTHGQIGHPGWVEKDRAGVFGDGSGTGIGNAGAGSVLVLQLKAGSGSGAGEGHADQAGKKAYGKVLVHGFVSWFYGLGNFFPMGETIKHQTNV